MAAECPGRCNRAYRRARRVQGVVVTGQNGGKEATGGVNRSSSMGEHGSTAEQPVSGPVWGDPLWCRPCRETIRAGLHRLPDLAAACRIRDDGKLPQIPETIRVAILTGSTSASTAFDTVDEIVQWAAAWEECGRRELARLGWDVPRGAALPSWNALYGRALTRASAFLVGWHVQLLALDYHFAKPFGEETLALVTTLEKVTGHDDTVTRLRAPCRRCDTLTLRRRDGSERVECVKCHDAMTMDEYEQWSKLCAHAASQGAAS